MSENKTARMFLASEILTVRKILRYRETTLVSRNKPDMITGIVKAVTKKLKSEDHFKILVVDY